MQITAYLQPKKRVNKSRLTVDYSCKGEGILSVSHAGLNQRFLKQVTIFASTAPLSAAIASPAQPTARTAGKILSSPLTPPASRWQHWRRYAVPPSGW